MNGQLPSWRYGGELNAKDKNEWRRSRRFLENKQVGCWFEVCLITHLWGSWNRQRICRETILQLKYKFPANSLPFMEAGPPNLDARLPILEWILCDDPAGRHLGRSGPTDPPQKEQCRKTVRTVLRTGPGVQRPKAPTTNQELLSLGRSAYLLSICGTSE